MPRARRALAVLAVAGLVGATSACGGDPGGGDDAALRDDAGAPEVVALPECPVDALDGRAADDGPVEVEVWHSLTGEPRQYVEALAAEYEGSQDRVRVTLQYQGRPDEVLRAYVAGIPSGDLPAVAYLEDGALRQLVDSDTILPAEACERADDVDLGQLPSIRQHYTVDGAYWPGYANATTPLLYLNAAHLARAGLDPDRPPGTLAEVREAAEAIAAAGVAETPLALALKPWFVEDWLAGAGEAVLEEDDDGTARSTFDNPATHEVYTWLADMAADGLLAAYSDTAGQLNHYLALTQQSASMLVETSTAATTIQSVLGGEDYEAGDDGIDTGAVDASGIAPAAGPFPGLEEPGQVQVAGSAFFLTSTGTAEEQAAAWDLMRFMAEVDTQVGWHLQGSFLPTTQAAAAAAAVGEYRETALAGRMLGVGTDQLLAVDADHDRPQVGPSLDVADAIRASLDRLVLERAPVAEVIAEADAAIQVALDEYAEADGG